MTERSVFVSVGTTATDLQERFVRAIEERLRNEGLTPHTLGRDTWSADAPLKVVTELMDRCVGVVVIALERAFYPAGTERRGGGDEAAVVNVKLPTSWNQIEAAMAYTRGLPILVIAETGLKSEGLIDRGHDWHVQWVRPDVAALTTPEFNGVLASWKQKLLDQPRRMPDGVADLLAALTIGQLISGMRPAQLWPVLAAIATLIGGAFALGAKLFS